MSFWGGEEQSIGTAPVPYFPKSGAALINGGASRIPLRVRHMPMPLGGGKRRPVDGAIDIGAYEWSPNRRSKNI